MAGGGVDGLNAEQGQPAVEPRDIVVLKMSESFVVGNFGVGVSPRVVVRAPDVGPDTFARQRRIGNVTGIGLRHTIKISDSIIGLAAQQRLAPG